MIPDDVIAAVHRYRARVRTQAQLAHDIQQLREVARMLFEDKPDKTKAVEAVNDIAAKRLARMDAEARALLDSATSNAGRIDIADRGDLLSWLMLVNQPGHFPYTRGTAEPGRSDADVVTHATRSATWAANDATGLARALADGWSWLAATGETAEGIESRALQCAIEFDEQRDREHGALAAAARRLWAVSLREHFGAHGDALKLQLIPSDAADVRERPDFEIGDRAADLAEDALLAALRALVTSSTRA